ncbi:MAG: hypothetical protein RR531_14110 [Longicatena sp.]
MALKVPKKKYVDERNKWVKHPINTWNSSYTNPSGAFYINEALRLCRLSVYTNSTTGNIDGATLCEIPQEVRNIIPNDTINLYGGSSVTIPTEDASRSIYLQLRGGLVYTITHRSNYVVYHLGCDVMFNY